MSKPNTMEAAWLRLVLENNTNDGILDQVGSGLRPSTNASNLYLGLHTNIVAEAANTNGQNTNEAPIGVYSNYARQAIARANASWTITNAGANAGVAFNVNAISFPQHTGATTVTCTHWSLGTTNSGPGTIVYSGPMATEDTKLFVVNDTSAFSGLTNAIQCIAHGYADASRVVFIQYPGRSLPSGITEGYAYHKVTTNADDVDWFYISTNAGGTAANLGSGEGLVAQIVPLQITQNSIPRVDSNQLVITED